MTLVFIFLLGVALGRASFYLFPSRQPTDPPPLTHSGGAGNDCDARFLESWFNQGEQD